MNVSVKCADNFILEESLENLLMFEEYIDVGMGVSDQGVATDLREEYHAILFLMFEALMVVRVSAQYADNYLRGKPLNFVLYI